MKADLLITCIFNVIIDSSKAQSRLEAMDAARQRMQAQLDAQAARHAEQMKQV